MTETQDQAAGPYAGFRVVDLGRFVAGPTAGMIFGDLGADVLKVETPPAGDFLRGTPPHFDEDVGHYFASANRNKRSVRLDLRSESGMAALRTLLADADVLIENFRPGVLEAMGFGDEAVARDFPRLVVLRISAYGQEGPDRDLPGVDQMVQGRSGLMHVTGTVETGPIRSGLAICDLVGGLVACMGAMAALAERERSGRGQVVRSSLLRSTMALMGLPYCKYAATGVDPGPEGNHHPALAPYGTFPTADGHVQLMVLRDDQFASLADLCGHPEWKEDPRLATVKGRGANRELVRDLVAASMGHRTTAEWLELLPQADIPCGPIYTVAEAFASAQAQVMQMALHTTLTGGKPVSFPGFLFELGRTPARLYRPPPHFGEHTDEVLAEIGAASRAAE